MLYLLLDNIHLRLIRLLLGLLLLRVGVVRTTSHSLTVLAIGSSLLGRWCAHSSVSYSLIKHHLLLLLRQLGKKF